jgi:hypothetical protein
MLSHVLYAHETRSPILNDRKFKVPDYNVLRWGFDLRGIYWQRDAGNYTKGNFYFHARLEYVSAALEFIILKLFHCLTYHNYLFTYWQVIVIQPCLGWLKMYSLIFHYHCRLLRSEIVAAWIPLLRTMEVFFCDWTQAVLSRKLALSIFRYIGINTVARPANETASSQVKRLVRNLISEGRRMDRLIYPHCRSEIQLTELQGV